jgi:hypothetical protein
MRGSSAGSLRPWGWPCRPLLRGGVKPVRGNVGRVGFQHQASSGSSAARRRSCRARSYVTAPPNPSLKPSAMNAWACCRLPLKAWAMPPRPHDLAQRLQQLVGRAAHMQDHRQAVAPGQLELLAVKQLWRSMGPVPAQSSRARFRPPPPGAGRHGAAAGGGPAAARSSGCARPCTGDECPARSCRRAGAPAAHGVPVAALYRGQHAMRHALRRGLRAHRARSASNSGASRWQWVSIQAGMAG